MWRTWSVLLWLALLLIALPHPAQAQAAEDAWIKTEAMVPMRDGVHLYTTIYTPKNATEPLPILFERTPYGIGDLTGIPREFANSYKELADGGYIFVFQDIRGKFKSEGEFVMVRSPRSGLEKVDEGTDAYDTIEWLLKNVPNNNGRVGILGISYGGWLTVMAMIEPHPAVMAVSPQASPASMFLGDDFFHNGAFRLSPSFGYAYMMETSKEINPYTYDQYDTFEWYLDLGPLSNVNELYIDGVSPSWNDFMEHPTYDAFWKRQETSHYLKAVTVPTLNVAGWWDAEDFYGAMKIYEVLEQYDTNHMNYLAVGPWRHGGWAGDGSELGALSFSPDPSLYFRDKIQAPWFAYHLKGEGSLDFSEAQVYETGANAWRGYDTWPPETETTPLRLYLRQDATLSFDPPTVSAGHEASFDEYVSDPAKPVPYWERPFPGFWLGAQAMWKVADQRFVHLRPDVLHYESQSLTEDLVVSGRIITHLFASTTGTDSDWIVKLIDVYPEQEMCGYQLMIAEMCGYQLMIADEVLRAKFRNSFEKPEPVPPNEVVEYVIDLNSRNHRFRKGHKIMIQVQSTWFPLIGRNPQTFVNIPTATEADYQKATQRVYHSDAWPSYVEVPVLTQPLAYSNEIIIPLEVLDRYVGNYELQPGFILTITREENQLIGQATGQSQFELFPISETKFYLKVVDAQITFDRNEVGEVESLTLHQGGEDQPAKKIE